MVRSLVPPFALLLAVGCGSPSEAPDARVPSTPRPDAAGHIDASTDPEPTGVGTDPAIGKAQIQAIRDADPGDALDLPLTNVRVTFVKPALDDDASGFFVQADADGPALFVAYTPGPDDVVFSVGDIVSLKVRQVGQVGGGAMFAVLAVDAPTVVDSGSVDDIADFALDANAQTFADGGASLEGRLVNLTDSIDTPRPSMQRQVIADFDGRDARLRVSASLADRLDFAKGCEMQINRGVVWRHKTPSTPPVAYVLAYDETQAHASACPRPRVRSAYSTGPQTVAVELDRRLDKASLTPAGFTVNGLAVTSVALHETNPRVAIVTTAAQQTGSYEIEVGESVSDIFGAHVYGSEAQRTVPFSGNAPYAHVIITEVAPNIDASRDQLELYAVTGGTLDGLTIEDGFTDAVRVARFKKVTVAAGDLIVVHFKPDTSKVTDETTSKTEGHKANDHAGAWDVYGYATAITYTDRVLVVRHAIDGPIDAVPFANPTAGLHPSIFRYDFLDAFKNKLWGTECAGTCSSADATAASVHWTGVGETPSGKTIQRRGNATIDSVEAWALRDGTLGASNP